MRHLGLSSFGPQHVQQAEEIATKAAFAKQCPNSWCNSHW
jgi:hypothetical protein